MKQIHEVVRELNIGEKDIQLYLDAYVDGELKVSKKADSLLANFIELLYTQMSAIRGTPFDSYTPGLGLGISNVTNASPIVVSVLNVNPTNWIGLPVYISQVEGNTAANGEWIISAAGFASPNGTITLQNSTGSGAYTRGGIADVYTTSAGLNRYYNNFQFNGIRVGRSSGSVTIVDKHLGANIGNGTSYQYLVYNSFIVSQDTADSVSAQVTTTQTYTNQSGATITVSEAGIYLAGLGNLTLCARDLIPGGIGVNNGATLTVNYRIKTVLGGTGGFLQTFMQQLYRQLSATTRTVMDITNTNRSYAQNTAFYFAAGPGGNSQPNVTNNSYPQTVGQNVGIVIGTDNTAVSMTDYALHAKIQHGSGAGQLYHHGVVFDPLFINYTNNTVSFNIIRLFENLSTGSVVIKEMGIYSGANEINNYSFYDVPYYMHCIERDALASPNWVTLNPGDIAKVTYKVQITL